MKATVKHLVRKVTLELIYDVVDERTKDTTYPDDKLIVFIVQDDGRSCR